MSGSVVTDNASKDDKVMTPIPGQGEEGKETNTGKIRGNRSRRRTELVQLRTEHRYLFKRYWNGF